MKNKNKLKRYIKRNNGALLIISTITIIGIAANINILLLQPYKTATVIPPAHKITETLTTTQKEPIGTIREISAYNAGDPAQTDSTPCISANGENICTALALNYKRCAANFVPFGTTLEIEHFGKCLVVDRMNSRYTNRVDIAMRADEKQRAISFGLQKLNVKIIK